MRQGRAKRAKMGREVVNLAVVQGPDLLTPLHRNLIWKMIVTGNLSTVDIASLTSVNTTLRQLVHPVGEEAIVAAAYAWQQLYAQKIVSFSPDENLPANPTQARIAELITQRVGMEWKRYLRYCPNEFWLMRACSIVNFLSGRIPINTADVEIGKYPDKWKVYYVQRKNFGSMAHFNYALELSYQMDEDYEFAAKYPDLIDTTNEQIIGDHRGREYEKYPRKSVLRGRNGEAILVFYLYGLIEDNIPITKENGELIPIQSALVVNCSHCMTNEAFYLCGQCKTATYCSAECQEQDWNTTGHRLECKK